MSNPWSGIFAKAIASKKRPRIFWNLFWGGVMIIALLVMGLFVYQAVGDRLTYTDKQIYEDYQNGQLTTNVTSFKIHSPKTQEVEIDKLLQCVECGEVVDVTISKISGELLEVTYQGEIVYRKEVTPILPTAIASGILVFPMLGLCIFMLFVTNTKKPSKRIRKIQNEFLLKN